MASKLNNPVAWEARMGSLQDFFVAANPFTQAKVVLEPSGVEIQVDVAESPEQRARGMIGREFAEGVPAMLFVEPVEASKKFHMRGVTQPLVLAIFDAQGGFLGSINMTADSSTVVHAHGFKFALEMSPEFFASVEFSGQKLRVVR